MKVSERLFPDGVFPAPCPGRTMMEHVTSKWGALALLVLAEEAEPLRWNQLRTRAQGVSEKMLSQTLRTLEADGLVVREALPVVPPHVEYSLTEHGQEAAVLLRPLMAWAIDHAEATSRSSRR